MKKNSNENLKNYAIWYYLKYFPSIKKLEQKLLLKSNNVVIVNKILKEIYNIFVEENIIYSLIKTYYEKWKNQNYIKNNLKLKLFDSTIIEKSLKKFFSNGTSNL